MLQSAATTADDVTAIRPIASTKKPRGVWGKDVRGLTAHVC